MEGDVLNIRALQSRNLLLIVIIIIMMASNSIAQKLLTARQVMEIVIRTNQSKKGIIQKGELECLNLKTKESVREKFLSLSIRQKKINRKLFRFVNKKNKGITLYTIERPVKNNLQYLYKKPDKNLKIISAFQIENNFINTDFSYEQIGGININNYIYTFLKDKKIRGKECYTVEFCPKDKDSIYSKHIVLINKNNFIPIAIKYYNKSGKIIKIMKVEDIRKITTNIFIAFKITMTNILDKHRTVMIVLEAEEKKLNIGYFNKKNISRRWKKLGL